MRARWRVAVAAALGAILAARSGVACPECDPAKPPEAIASLFEARDDTVYDRSTNLSWMRCSYGQAWTESGGCSGSVELLDWDSAMGLRLAGNPAWRLPQKDELGSIVATNCKRPAINETVFLETPSIQYWTSTTSGPSYAWVVFFRCSSWHLI